MEDKKFSLDEILETMYAALYSLERERGQEANVDMAMMQAMMYPPVRHSNFPFGLRREERNPCEHKQNNRRGEVPL